MGEVLDARSGQLADLTQAQTLALVAIAEKCHADSRQGAVWLAHVEAAIGKSKRTAVRTLEQLKDRGLIRVVKRGYKSHGVIRPNIFELLVLAPPRTAQANDGGCASQDGASADDVLAPDPDVLAPDSNVVAPSLGGNLNGSRDGSKDGGARAREASPTPELEPSSDDPPPTSQRIAKPEATAAATAAPPTPDPDGALADDATETTTPGIDGGAVDVEPDPTPPWYCGRHPDDVDRPCHACKMRRKAWERDHPDGVAAPGRITPSSPLPVPGYQCPRCRDGGLVLNTDGSALASGPLVCHHDGTWHEATPDERSDLNQRRRPA
ncbi:Uncharacterised protein [Mycolicibacterium aurum]|uniref:Helix-turn-helix domain-containing protein n=1 Tax=Mycolicibacterium aurum TaxID=1791 RepID=A0A448IT78_MYCAU|nr:Uncharacterised protein [Mycolicibacterium aurum]